MRIPFTAPQLPELDALPLEKRRVVLASYASSSIARRFIRVVQIGISAAAVSLCVALNAHGPIRLVCCLASILFVVGAVAYYRVSATQAIRTILRSREHGEDRGNP